MAAKRPPLAPRRQQYASARASGVFIGKPLHYPAAPAARYAAELGRLVGLMRREYLRDLVALFGTYGPAPAAQDASLASQARIALNKLQDKFARMFRQAAGPLVDRIFGQVDKASAASLQQSLRELSGGLTLKTDTMPAPLAEIVTARTAENVALIKSIPQQFHDQIARAVLASVQPGANGLADVREAVGHYGMITANRADLIAHDQTRKLTAAMTSERAKAAGVRKFRWLHSAGGAEPRPLHKNKLDGQVFSYDAPPIIDERTGERGLPGQLINCRCVAQPVVDFGDVD